MRETRTAFPALFPWEQARRKIAQRSEAVSAEPPYRHVLQRRQRPHLVVGAPRPGALPPGGLAGRGRMWRGVLRVLFPALFMIKQIRVDPNHI